ncbi:uncharacterized protein LOC126572431 [Anopheles aquasalis]|uniref:uncharacterized protein LOC126572431 n=1 Tax=Anopheles aquasalis TaxID=42839 RepID=UPI00215A6683|nr:uncharacterized protein LOC126572431 [Anopheles aquasalis]XP_050087705.1 uncharacterized protein LOC126572431 [Anopheles aquasalis]XP_050087706.1 uncharacterized protein LOC126572431 [Anopheles aquasalis]XP_050087707.1 uncharacterized protein LOC126572431 [Anopheles aquasalis]XP_050087709.1 uncharacterized protein LOC126572431 [Anopheles aquasalis]
MPGVVFLVCVPTATYERTLINGVNYGANEQLPPPLPPAHQPTRPTNGPGRNLNINLPESVPQPGAGPVVNRTGGVGDAVLRLEVELRDKHALQHGHGRRPANRVPKPPKPPPYGAAVNVMKGPPNVPDSVPLEKVLDELLKKLEVDRVIWHPDKEGQYYQVVFPLAAGDPCETTLHCLTELGIGVKHNSSVSVLPCSVSYDGSNDTSNEDEYGDESEENSKWNNFVDSIRSKLTVKQVVDGVRAGGSLSFDYLLLIVTADSLAALGLVENNAPNIVAAMLVSPLMGPVMSITFGAIIADRELVKVGFTALALGMFISILFGFIFGLILGTTEMPWGFGDFPTEEMKGRGNARSLWMGILWALTSGSGVAVALLQGSAGPLIGVAISASLLPPVVNCGLFWALACIWLIYEDIKIPHLKGEAFSGNSSYEFIYTNYIPTEFLINGIVSGLLTVINVICIFITAIIVLKIKEVAAPYTSSPDLRRFWETDIRTARTANRTTIRRNRGAGAEADIMSTYAELENDPKARNLENALEQALKEAVDDDTYRKVKRMSYSSNAAGEIAERLFGHGTGGGVGGSSGPGMAGTGGQIGNPMAASSGPGTTTTAADLKLLEKLVTSLLEAHGGSSTGSGDGHADGRLHRSGSTLGRFRPMSRSFRSANSLRRRNGTADTGGNDGSTATPGGNAVTAASLTMPTIQESGTDRSGSDRGRRNSWSDRAGRDVRRVLNTIANAPQRFSQSIAGDGESEERSNLTQNIL